MIMHLPAEKGLVKRLTRHHLRSTVVISLTSSWSKHCTWSQQLLLKQALVTTGYCSMSIVQKVNED
jgi:hypothetical protein